MEVAAQPVGRGRHVLPGGQLAEAGLPAGLPSAPEDVKRWRSDGRRNGDIMARLG